MQQFDPMIPRLLPAEAMYSIQVGTKLFKVSGASLSSDGPSYFTDKFSREPQQAGEVLFIDRCSDTFQLIYLHLQGYVLDIRDEMQFTTLVSDAMYYNLPRLRRSLQDYDYLFANVSGRTFKIAKSLFKREGDSFNYFTLTSDRVYADLESVFIDKQLLRPPPQEPLYVSRSADLLQDLLQWLGGATMELDDSRRASLVAEARYYHLQNLEQRLLKAQLSYNPLTGTDHIMMRLQDLQEGHFEFPDHQLTPAAVSLQENCCSDSTTESTPSLEGPLPQLKRFKSNPSVEKLKKKWNFACYKRPFVDQKAHELVFQIDPSDCTLVFNRRNKIIHLQLASQSAKRFEKLFSKPLKEIGINLANYKVKDQGQEPKYGLPACISIADFTVNGMKCPHVTRLVAEGKCDERVIDFADMDQLNYCSGVQLHLTKSLWKFGVNGSNLILIALKAEAFTGIKEYCRTLEYL